MLLPCLDENPNWDFDETKSKKSRVSGFKEFGDPLFIRGFHDLCEFPRFDERSIYPQPWSKFEYFSFNFFFRCRETEEECALAKIKLFSHERWRISMWSCQVSDVDWCSMLMLCIRWRWSPFPNFDAKERKKAKNIFLFLSLFELFYKNCMEFGDFSQIYTNQCLFIYDYHFSHLNRVRVA